MPVAPHRPRESGNLDLAEQLYRAHRTHLLAIARRNSACNEDAEEALQDAFALFINHYRTQSGAPALAWLTLTLKRRCWALYKQQRLRRAGAGALYDERVADTKRLPQERAEVLERVAQTRTALAKLKPAERRALGLRALGHSYAEICQLTGWTYTKVNRCLAEGRARLRQLTDPVDDWAQSRRSTADQSQDHEQSSKSPYPNRGHRSGSRRDRRSTK